MPGSESLFLFCLSVGTYFHFIENSTLVLSVFDDMEDDIGCTLASIVAVE